MTADSHPDFQAKARRLTDHFAHGRAPVFRATGDGAADLSALPFAWVYFGLPDRESITIMLMSVPGAERPWFIIENKQSNLTPAWSSAVAMRAYPLVDTDGSLQSVLDGLNPQNLRLA